MNLFLHSTTSAILSVFSLGGYCLVPDKSLGRMMTVPFFSVFTFLKKSQLTKTFCSSLGLRILIKRYLFTVAFIRTKKNIPNYLLFFFPFNRRTYFKSHPTLFLLICQCGKLEDNGHQDNL